MRQQQVLKGPVWPAPAGLALGAGWLLEDVLNRGAGPGVLTGVGFVVLGVTHLVSRNTLIEEQGIKPAGCIRRRVRWADVLAVEQSRMALHHQDVELTVRGRRQPIRLKERRGGGDFAAVHQAWLSHETQDAQGP
jgi:hypothetical protein